MVDPAGTAGAPLASSGGDPTPPSGGDKPGAPVPADNTEGYWKRQAERAQKELDAHKKAQMTEAERIKSERDEAIHGRTVAEQRADQTLMQARFETEAAKAGCVDPEAAFALMGVEALRVEGGKVHGIKQAIEALQKGKPYLFGGQAPRRGAGGGNPPGGSGVPGVNQRINDFIRSYM